MVIIIGITNEDGSISLPEGAEIPNEIFESICLGDTYYFFLNEEERNLFYDQHGIPR